MISLNLDQLAGMQQEVLDTLTTAENSWGEFMTLADAEHPWTGWFDAPRKNGFNEGKFIQSWAKEVDVHYDCVVVCGIGGSFAGTKAVDDALYPKLTHNTPTKPIYYAGNHLCERSLIELLDHLQDKYPLINVVSKSGTTTEPALAFRALLDYIERKFPDEIAQRVVVTTDVEKGDLCGFVEQQGCKSFVIPSNIGGRFSVLSAVGLVPLCLAGYEVSHLLTGADQLYTSLRAADSAAEAHPVWLHAAARHTAWSKGIRIDALAYTTPKLDAFVAWWKQLFGESEGKQDKGLFPAGLAYTTDLHSMGQYLQQGWPAILETFMTFNHSGSISPGGIERRLKIPAPKAAQDKFARLVGRNMEDINSVAMESAYMAHASRGIPCLKLEIDGSLNLHTLGYMFAYFQCVCTLTARLAGLNPFDQPGVEDYKKNMFRLLEV
ncbi:MAG: glucose-6-phosphate isomerase [Zetaproteobacteria bacterium]|nr:glucose-6-phosphate isomerase [Zetaproteobacteria bacterium]